MRKRLYYILEMKDEHDKVSKIYDTSMFIIIILSLIPIVIHDNNIPLFILEAATTIIFIIDYLARWITADYLINKGKKSFILYPFTAFAIIDLLSILPSIFLINKSIKLLRIFRLLRLMKFFKIVRHSKNIILLENVLKKQKSNLIMVLVLAVSYILITAAVIYNVEPETFKNYFEAVYWSTISLTTVGYGDIYATSIAGKIITMISSFCGIAIIALPSGIITAGYMKEINEIHQKEEANKEQEE